MERKTLSFKIVNLNPEGRTLEGYAAAFGNLDQVGDIIHPGAFTKTLAERGQKIKLLWQHKLDEPIGRVAEAHEDQAGLFIKAIISDTSRGRDALALLKDGAIYELSIGYDAVKGGTDYSKSADGVTVRNLREIKLYEVSLVTFPANEMATVTALKEKPSEAKPWMAVQEGDKWRVYKLDEDGNPTGDPLGEHDNEDAANAQIQALYASEEKADKPMKTEAGIEYPASCYLVVEDAEMPTTWHLRVRDENGEIDHRLMGAAWAALHGGYRGNVYEGPGKTEAIAKLRGMYEAEDMPMPDEKAGRRMRRDKAELLKNLEDIVTELRQWADYEDGEPEEEEPKPEIELAAPLKAADNEHEQKQAGPTESPTSKLKRLIEIERERLHLLEV